MSETATQAGMAWWLARADVGTRACDNCSDVTTTAPADHPTHLGRHVHLCVRCWHWQRGYVAAQIGPGINARAMLAHVTALQARLRALVGGDG